MACQSAFGADRMRLDGSFFQLEVVLWRVRRARFQAVSDLSPFFSAALSHLQLDHRADVRAKGNPSSLDRCSGISLFSCDKSGGVVLASLWFI